MFKQSQLPLLLTFILPLLLGGGACSRQPAVVGLVFDQPLVDLGERWAGETIPLEFPFSVRQQGVRIEQALPECGCLAPTLWVDGQKLPWGQELVPGTKGKLVVEFHTAGFQGRKFTGVDLQGVGPGLPTKLEVHSWLRPWFELRPRFVDFGIVRGEKERVVEVEVKGQKPFRVTAILGQAPPIEVRGIPSTKARLVQKLQIVLPPTQAEGNHFGVLNFGSDQEGFAFTLPVNYKVAGNLWTIPDQKLLLGELQEGVKFFAQVELGARSGVLKAPEVVLKQLPEASYRVETVVEGARYRVQLSLTPGPDHVVGEILLRLPYQAEGETEKIVERRLRVLGAVRRQNDD